MTNTQTFHWYICLFARLDSRQARQVYLLILTCYTNDMSLTTTAKKVRLILKLGWLVIFIPLIALFIHRIMSAPGRRPPGETPPPAFTAVFGKVPALAIDTIGLQSGTPSVTLDLVNARLPESPEILEVFPILSAPYGFLSRDRALELARKIGFSEEPQVVDETQLVWRRGLESLTMNATTLNFRYTYDYRSNPTVFRPGRFATENFAVSAGNKVMSDLAILGGTRGPDLSKGQVTSQKLRYDGTDLVSSATLAQTSAILINYSRIPIQEIQVVSPTYYNSIVNILVPSVTEPKMLELNYTYWEFDRKKGGTYPVTPASSAMNLFLQSPDQYIVFLGDAETAAQDTTITSVTEYIVKQMHTAYFDTAEYQQYLQPIWVVLGEAVLASRSRVDFVAYIPAITNEWIQ